MEGGPKESGGWLERRSGRVSFIHRSVTRDDFFHDSPNDFLGLFPFYIFDSTTNSHAISHEE